MMTFQHTRRDVLTAVGTATATTGFAVTTAAGDDRSVQVVEAGLRFELPPNDDYDGMRLDSRPPFTIDREKGRLVVLNTASPGTAVDIAGADDLVDERTAHGGTEVTVGPPDGELSALPTELSGRLRPKRAVDLRASVAVPIVVLQTRGSEPALNAEGEGRVPLPVGQRVTVELDPVSAVARTSHVVGKASADGLPDYRAGLRRESGRVDVEAVPVVEAINHGELVVKEQAPANRNG